ncbi:MAG: lipid II:glycine glycyltransferase FemX [Candidatus Dormibacteraceae bacterium]
MSPNPVDPQIFDQALDELQHPIPLNQTSAMGLVQSEEGWQVERVLIPGQLAAQVLLRRSGLGTLGYVPRGPLPATLPAIRTLLEWAIGARLAALRIEPEATPELADQLRQEGFVPAEAMQPISTLIVPLDEPEEMLQQFKPKHRYNIRLAIRKGVTVRLESDPQTIYSLGLRTARRQRFRPIPLSYYQLRMRHLPGCQLYTAYSDNQPLAAALIARVGERTYYLAGGSDESYRQLMGSYLLHWEIMCAAAAAGGHDYDMWGIPPAPAADHPWSGLWQFKTGFNGQIVTYPGAWERVLSWPQYRSMQIASKLHLASRQLRAAIPYRRGR